jgi:hypothetical protein
MIKEKPKKDKLEIDLTGPEGNAFNLIGVANRLSKQLDFDSNKMMSGDYENLVKVFDSYFGDFVILYR